MKALTLTQPWATLVISGAKRIETRSWPTAYRGRVAIHAAKTIPRWARAACYEIYFRQSLAERDWDELPCGCVLGIVEVIDCRPTDSFNGLITPAERAMDDFSPGRFGWVLANPIPMTPVPARGALGLWEWTMPTEPSWEKPFYATSGAEYAGMSEDAKRAVDDLGRTVIEHFDELYRSKMP